MIVCAGCDKPITDKFLMNVLDQSWHSSCVTCTDCKTPLTETCYSRERMLYCKKDFFKQFGTKCAGCNNGISPNEMVRKAKDKVYHLKCFICVACKKQLTTGEELYILPEQKFLCRSDYLNSRLKDGIISDMDDGTDDLLGTNDNADLASEVGDCSDRETSFDGDLLSSPHDDCVKDPLALDSKHHNNNNMIQTDISSGSPVSEKEEESNSVGDDVTSNKRRGPRTTIKAKQLEVLKAAFAATPKPTRHIREQLAAETGLNMRVIQVWFQNRRSKERRLKQMNSMGARRPFFGRTGRRMRSSQMDDSPDMPPPYAFYHPGEVHTPDGFYGLYPGYPHDNFYPNQPNSAPPPEAFMSNPDMQPVAHQGMHDGFMADVISPQANNPADMMGAGGPLENTFNPRNPTVYNNMAHPPQPIESW